jgi:choline dehydrogenase-like flavoprotein
VREQGDFDVLALGDDVLTEQRLLCASGQLRLSLGRLRAPSGWDYELYLRVEQAPNPESRVRLGEWRDRFDCPRPVLEWRTLECDWDSVVRSASLLHSGLDWWFATESRTIIKPGKPWPWPANGPARNYWTSSWGNHHLGTTRMSDDPSEGVVDRDCLVHGTENLYVAGSSVFPTGSCANPTFTIVALAHRLAATLAARG